MEIHFVAPTRLCCGWCHRECEELKICKRCKIFAYCNETCQMKDWQAGHRYWCGCARRNRRSALAISEERLVMTSIRFSFTDLFDAQKRAKYYALPPGVVKGELERVFRGMGVDLYAVESTSIAADHRAEAMRSPAGATVLGVVLVRFQGKSGGGFGPTLEWLSSNKFKRAKELAAEANKRREQRVRPTYTDPGTLYFPTIPTAPPQKPVQTQLPSIPLPAPVPAVTQQARYVGTHKPNFDDAMRVQRELRSLAAQSAPYAKESEAALLKAHAFLTGQTLPSKLKGDAQLPSPAREDMKKYAAYTASAIDYEDYISAEQSCSAALAAVYGGRSV